MTPTRHVVDALLLDAMSTASKKADWYALSVGEDATRLRNTITGLDWSGGARMSADNRATSECTEIRRVSAAFTSLANAIDNGHTAMSHLASTLKQGASGYESDGYDVADNWKVSDGYNYGLAEAFATEQSQQDRLAQLKRERANHAANATVRLTRLAQELGTADHTCAAAIRAASGALYSSAPVSSGVGGGSGRQVADSLREGRPLTGDEMSQLMMAGQLTPEQIDAIRHGREVDIPQGQYDFLRGLMAGLGNASISDVVGMGVGDDHEQVQIALANAFEAAGKPMLGTTAGDHGGMAMLPTSARTLLSDNLIGDRFDVVSGGRVGSKGTQGVTIPRINDFNKFVDLMGKGDSGLRMGSDVDRGILKQTSEIAGATRDPSVIVRESPHSAAEGYGHQDLNDLLNKAMSVTAPDTTASHDFITGHNMDATMPDGGHYNVSEHLNGLLGHRWGVDAGGIDKVFGWVGDDATSPNPYLAGQAHQSASTLGHYFGNGHNLYVTQDFGINSSHLAQTISHSLSPYLGGFSGAPDGVHGVPTLGVDPLNPGELHLLFQGLNSDPGSAAIINNAGHQWQNLMAYQYGMNPDHASLGHSAGLLSQAMTHGYTDEVAHLRGEAYGSAAADYDYRMARYSQTIGAISAIPGAGAIVSASIPPELATALFGAPPDADSITTPTIDALKKIGVDSLNDPEVRDFSLFAGYVQSHPEVALKHPEWFTDGKPDWEKILSTERSMNGVRDFISGGKGPPTQGWDREFHKGEAAPDVSGTPVPRP